MSVQIACPDPTHWRALLEGALSSEEQADLSLHLDQCDSCRQQLETLSGGDEPFTELTRRLCQPRPAVEQGLQQALAELKEHGSQVDSEPALEEDQQIPLDFLSPSENPGHLGRLSHYDVLEVIGRGGMGIVLKAFDQKLQRVVAIKVMAPHLAVSASARKRFVREARAAAAIRNEHVIDIHAVEEANGLPYFVMEYVSGVSLQERLNETGPFELKEILRIGMQAARGLAAAHAVGMIHRDIKPANILLENGVERVKLTDFGLARAVDDASLTQSGVVAGTPQYMSPEQARGEALDARGDLFSLGSVLYALCTGHPPFRAGSSIAVLKRICEDQPGDLRASDPAIPDWLVALIERLHAKDPANRFQSAAEVADLLAQHLAHLQQPGCSEAAGLLSRSEDRESKIASPRSSILNPRSSIRAWGGGVVLLTLSVSLMLLGPAIYRYATNQGQLIIETDDSDVEVTIKKEGELVQIVDKKSGRTVTLKAGKYQLELADGANGLTLSTDQFTLERGGKEIVKVRLGPPVITEVRRFGGAPEATWRAAFCLDERCVLSGGGIGFRDGKLTAGTDLALHLWDRATGKELRRLEGHTGSILCLAVSPDGKRAVSGGTAAEGENDFAVRVWDLETYKELRRFTKHTGRVMGVAFLPNGRQVVSVGGPAKGEVRLWELETCEEVRQFIGHEHEVRSVAVSTDGKRMLTTGQDNQTFLWNVESGEKLRSLKGADHSGGNICLARDGRRAAVSCWDGSIWCFEVDSGKTLRRFGSQTGEIIISPDGRRILSCHGDNIVRLWNIDTGTEVCRFEGDWQGPLGVRGFTADGREALINSWDGSLRLLRLPPASKK